MEVCQYPFSPISVKTATGRWYIKARNRIGIRASPLSCSFKKKNETTPRVREYSRVLLEARKFNAGIPHEIFPNFTCGEIFSRNHLDCRQNRRLFPSPSLSLILFSPAICTFHKPFCFLSPTPPSLPAGKINWKKEREGERKEKEKTHNAIADGNVLPTLRYAYVYLRTSVSLFSKTCSTSLQKFAALILSLCYPRGLVRFQLFRVTQSDTHRDEEKREERDRVHVWEKRYSRIFYFFSNSRFTMGCINYLEEWLFKKMSRVRENERTL